MQAQATYMFVVNRNGLQHDIAAELRQLRSLLEDLEQIAAGHLPSVELVDAPFLDSYRRSVKSAWCLIGEVQGHPICHGPLIKTSELWAISPELGWARTFSRYYRLGSPADNHDDFQ